MKATHCVHLVVAWLRPNSLWPFAIMLLYGRYFSIVTDEALPLADAYLAWLLAAALPGIWFGHCARDAHMWPAALFVPAYTRTLSGMVVASAGAALALGLGAAWGGGLASWTSAAFGILAVAVALLTGFYWRYGALVAFAIVGVSLTLVVRDAGAAFVAAFVQLPFVPGMAVLLGGVLFACFLHGVRTPRACGRWPFAESLRRYSAWCRSAAIAPPPWWIVGVFGVAAIAVALISRYRSLGLNGEEWLALTGLQVWVICTGQSRSLPHGKLTVATSLLLLGAGETRVAVARRVLSRAVGDSLLGATTFMIVTSAFGVEIRWADVFVTLAACHLYLVGASGSLWLLSSSRSALVAAPIVALLAWFGCRLLSMNLSAAIVACVACAASTIYWGGRRMGRLDFTG